MGTIISTVNMKGGVGKTIAEEKAYTKLSSR